MNPPPFSNRKEFLILGCVLLSAVLIRIWGINFGLPGLFHWDERWFMVNSFCILTRNLKGMAHIHSSFLAMLLALPYGIYYIILRIIGIVNSPIGFLAFYLRDPSSVYLIGRTLFALLGVLVVWLTYIIGKALYSKREGLVAAFFTAFAYLLVQQSKFMKGDTAAALFILLSFYYAIRLNKGIRYYILCGICLGLALASKYYAFIFLLVPLFLHFRTTKWSAPLASHSKLLFLILISALTFIALSPCVILAPKDFLHQLLGCRLFSAWVPQEGIPISLFYIKEYLRGGMGLPLEIISFLGCLYLLKTRRSEEIGILIFVFPFLLLLNFLTNFDRLAVPLIPFLVLAASKLLCDLTARLKCREIILWLVAGLVILPSAISSIKYDYLITRADTRHIAKEWIEENIPPNSKVVNEGGRGPERTSVLSAPIYANKGAILKDIVLAKESGLKGTYPQALLKIERKVAYELKSVVALNWIHIGGTPKIQLPTIEPYLEETYEWLITSSWIRNGEEGEFPYTFIHSLRSNYELVKEFIPYPEFLWDYYCYRTDFKALRKVRRFSQNVIGGPRISIYKKR